MHTPTHPASVDTRFGLFSLFVLLFWLLTLDMAWASDTGGMPWEAPLQTISDSLTGPIAGFVALIGIVVAGGTLIFGGELGEFARRGVMLALVLSILLAATQVVTSLGLTASAVV